MWFQPTLKKNYKNKDENKNENLNEIKREKG